VQEDTALVQADWAATGCLGGHAGNVQRGTGLPWRSGARVMAGVAATRWLRRRRRMAS